VELGNDVVLEGLVAFQEDLQPRRVQRSHWLCQVAVRLRIAQVEDCSPSEFEDEINEKIKR
jgi:hypothetical protein